MERSECERLVKSLLRLTEGDTRIAALLVYGSHADDVADRFSDLDVGVVADDIAYEELVADAPELIRALGTPLFLSDFGDRGRLHAILAHGADLELIVARESDLELGDRYRVLFDRSDVVGRALARRRAASAPAIDRDDVRRRIDGFWHDIGHLVTALGRGNTWWAYGQLDELRRQCLNLARLEAGMPPEEEAYWKVDEALLPERLAVLHATVASPEVGPIRTAALALLDRYRDLAIPLAARHHLAYPDKLDRLLSNRLTALVTPVRR